MTDLGLTIAPKSDQLNADDLLTGPITIKITDVSRCKEPEQPIAINYEGDKGKPYKPGKSMRRVLVNAWGADGQTYKGRSLTLYRDEEVMFGGLKVGGIRISNMSHITENTTMALTASRASRKPFTVRPLVQKEPAAKGITYTQWLEALGLEFAKADTDAAVDALAGRSDVVTALEKASPAVGAQIRALHSGAKARVAANLTRDGEPVA